MNALSPIPPKTAKLIPRLATNHDGEVVATVRAIERTLRSSGLDFHDPAGALQCEPQTGTVVIYRDWEPDEPTTWHGLARWCRDHDEGHVKQHERDFIDDMVDRLIREGDPSERQARWLRALYAKLRRRAGQ